MRKILIAIALLTLVATNAEARDGWHGHGGGGHFFFFAPFIAALTLPFYYSRFWADPGPYYYPGPTDYVQYPPSDVVAEVQPRSYVTELPPRAVVTQSPGNGVVEVGPVSALQLPSSNSGHGPAEQWFVYPSKGQSQEQQAQDRNACSRWATSQSGYDPDLRAHRHPDTGPADFGRALSACLAGRGYALR